MIFEFLKAAALFVTGVLGMIAIVVSYFRRF